MTQLRTHPFPFAIESFNFRFPHLLFCRASRKGVRLAYMGHLTLISEDVIAALALYPHDLSATLAKHCPQPQWDAYVSGRFKETKARDSSQLGGGKPSVTSLPRLGMGSEVVAASPAGRSVGLNVDEAERLPSLGGGGAEASSKPRPPVQNVLFSAVNEDEENATQIQRMSATSPQSEEV